MTIISTMSVWFFAAARLCTFRYCCPFHAFPWVTFGVKGFSAETVAKFTDVPTVGSLSLRLGLYLGALLVLMLHMKEMPVVVWFIITLSLGS